MNSCTSVVRPAALLCLGRCVGGSVGRVLLHVLLLLQCCCTSQCLTRHTGSVETTRLCGSRKNIPMHQRPLHEHTHVLLLYVLLRCCRRWVLGWVSRWIGCCTCCFRCTTSAVVLLYMVHNSFGWVSEWQIPLILSSGGIVAFCVMVSTYYYGTYSCLPVYRSR